MSTNLETEVTKEPSQLSLFPEKPKKDGKDWEYWEEKSWQFKHCRKKVSEHYQAIKKMTMHPSRQKHLWFHGRADEEKAFHPDNMDPEWMTKSYELANEYIQEIQFHTVQMEKWMEKMQEIDNWIREHHVEYFEQEEHKNLERANLFKKFLESTMVTIKSSQEEETFEELQKSVAKEESGLMPTPFPGPKPDQTLNSLPILYPRKDQKPSTEITKIEIEDSSFRKNKFQVMVDSIKDYEEEIKAKHWDQTLLFFIRSNGKLYKYKSM